MPPDLWDGLWGLQTAWGRTRGPNTHPNRWPAGQGNPPGLRAWVSSHLASGKNVDSLFPTLLVIPYKASCASVHFCVCFHSRSRTMPSDQTFEGLMHLQRNIFQEKDNCGLWLEGAKTQWGEGSGWRQKSKPRRLREDSSSGWRPSAWPISFTKQVSPGLNLYCAQLGQMDRICFSVLTLSWIFNYSLLGSSQHLLPLVSRPEPDCREPHMSGELGAFVSYAGHRPWLHLSVHETLLWETLGTLLWLIEHSVLEPFQMSGRGICFRADDSLWEDSAPSQAGNWAFPTSPCGDHVLATDSVFY